ncbi:MAG TPA: hypothetical protein VFX14_08775, partial [Methylomirabilota bacterium]|nr:hypothetical protein [Methylomirabilota bacterium]
HLLRAGAQVEVTGPGLHVPLGRGPAQRHAVLTALALWDPDAPRRARAGRVEGARRAGLREIRVSVG